MRCVLICDVCVYGPEGRTLCDREVGVMYELCVICIMLHVLCLYYLGPEGEILWAGRQSITGRKAIYIMGRKAILLRAGRQCYVDRKVRAGRQCYVDRKIRAGRRCYVDRKIRAGRQSYVDRKIRAGRRYYVDRKIRAGRRMCVRYIGELTKLRAYVVYVTLFQVLTVTRDGNGSIVHTEERVVFWRILVFFYNENETTFCNLNVNKT